MFFIKDNNAGVAQLVAQLTSLISLTGKTTESKVSDNFS